ncbi:hypothetical protein ACMXYR_13100 [Neptuniibacter sp. QD29_5]|uniref:hypothetical protein n=1 Tax=Neptuniibacter sp. QD29_5 TaxID=3398207 RepID=UPI0039F4CC47
MLSFLNKKAAGKGLLVLKTDGFGLRATVINGNRDALKVTVSVSSQQIDPIAALTDVLEQLKNVLGKNVPSNALLLHISAIPDLVQITESFDSPEAENLLEMLRWEMEGVVAMQSPNWDLGWLLMGRGYITPEQREELVHLVTEEKQLSAQHGGRSPMRLGEVAIREQMVSKEQIAECLHIQQKLQLADQRLLTQWRPQPKEESPYSDDDLGDAQKFLCSAMPAAQHQQWLDAVKKVGGSSGFPKLNLRQVYPFAGSSVPLLDSSDTLLITEFHKAYVFCAVLQDNQIREVAMVKCSSHVLDAGAVAEVLTTGSFAQANRWLVADGDSTFNDQISQLESLLQLDAESLAQAAADKIPSGRNELLAELGAARHFLGSAPLSVAPLIGMPPPDPIYRSNGFKIAMAACVLPLLIAAYEGAYHLKLKSLEAELLAAEQQLEAFKDQSSKARKKYTEAKQNIAVFQKKTKELGSLQAEKQLVEQVIVKRQSFVERLLPVLSESINDGVVLESMKESSWYEFSITGKAVDQASIDDFNQVLSISLEPLNMYIAKSPSNFRGDSALMQNGIYVFEFVLKYKGAQ